MPSQLGKLNKKFQFATVDNGARKREYETALDWLLASNLLLKCDNVTLPESPLNTYHNDIFKIYLSDIGVLRQLSKITINEIVLMKNDIFSGVLAENYVAKVLLKKYRELHYYQKNNEYEVDFLINIDGDIIPIEVKASENIKSIPLYAAYLI